MYYTVHGILQARMLEWVAFSFSRGSSQPRDQTKVSHIADRLFTIWAPMESLVIVILKKERKKERNRQKFNCWNEDQGMKLSPEIRQKFIKS